MTTPDKEVMPTDRTAGPWIVHYGEAVKIKDANGYTVASLSQIHLHGRRSKNEVEKTARFIVTACNAYEPMRKALEKVMVGGNHLGLIIGADHPPHTANHEEARTHYADAIWTYEAWCCWKTIMEARPALSTLPVNDRHHSGSDNERLRDVLALLEEELVWHEERDESLSKQPQSNQVVWRRAEHQERMDVIRAALKGVPQPASEAGKA